MIEAEFLELWAGCPEVDKKAILGSIRAHVRYCTERRETYQKQHKDSLDPKVLEALDNRERFATLVHEFLGGQSDEEDNNEKD